MNKKTLLAKVGMLSLLLLGSSNAFAQSSTLGYVFYPASYPNEWVMWPEVDYNYRFTEDKIGPVVGFNAVPWFSIQALTARAGLNIPVGFLHSEVLLLGGAGFAIGVGYKDEVFLKATFEASYRQAFDLFGLTINAGSGIAFMQIYGTANRLFYGVPVELGFSY